MNIRTFLLACALVGGALLLGLNVSAQTLRPSPTVVKIIGFNDYHGTLLTPGTFGVNTLVPPPQRPPVGGAGSCSPHRTPWRRSQ